jgi:hypothetical protein
MIRPWYRSRLFWLGLPGLVFLMWLWGDSMKMGRWVWCGESHRCTLVGVIGGTIDLKRFSVNQGISRPSTNFFRERVGSIRRRTVVPQPPPTGILCAEYGPREPLGGMLDHEMEDPFPPPISRFQRQEIDQRVSYRIGIALWLVIAGYASVWWVVLIAWQRRKARLIRRASAEMPGT